MTIVQSIYNENSTISDLDLAMEIIQHEKLTSLDLWLLPQYPFNEWRRKYDYPNLLQSMKENQADFTTWMSEQELTDDHLLNGYLSDFFEHKSDDLDKKRYVIKVFYKGKTTFQSWNNFSGETSHEGDGELITYEFIKAYISYYDWKMAKGEHFNFLDTFHRQRQNTPKENVYVNRTIKLLKMGGRELPTNSAGILLSAKKLEFINLCGLELKGTVYFGSMGNLSFDHCAIDNLKCHELDMPLLDFQNSSIKNIQINNSYVRQWLFVSCHTTGNIIDSKLSFVKIHGGQFNPAFTNSEIGEIEIQQDDFLRDDNFDKTYRSLANCAREAGNKKLYSHLKICEHDFVRAKTKGIQRLLSTLDKVYWEYGQRPNRLIYISLTTIFLFAFFYSFFPEDFKNEEFSHMSYLSFLSNMVYFSVQAFTTVGDSDIAPKGIIKVCTAIEGLFGVITMGFLVGGIAKED